MTAINTRYSSQHGSALFYILIAVALIAALSYVVSQTNRGNVSTVTGEQAKLAANEIIEYGNVVAAAVQKLRLRGCTDTQISFDNSLYTGYTNGSAPSDNSCHVFDSNGGSINYARAPDPFFNASNPAWRQSYGFMVGTEWEGNGETCSATQCVDLIMLLGVNEDTCNRINNMLGIDGMPEDTVNGTPFAGVYSAAPNIVGDVAASEEMEGKTAACMKSGATSYSFLQVILAR